MEVSNDVHSKPLLARHDSEFSADSGYVSSPHEFAPSTVCSIRSQYLEALYSTKTSLAYFAKSALSRVRSEFQNGQSRDDSLIALLRNLIYDDDSFTFKYETYLPNVLKNGVDCPSLPISGEEHGHLIQRFKMNEDKDNKLTESALQREINDLKIREY